jgi:large subunit ribosomal protein L10
MQDLRKQLRAQQADMKVAKNTLTKLAAHARDISGLDEVLEGPTALVFAWDDPAQPAKVVRDFARTSRILAVKAAVMEGEILSAEQVTAIADLPSRDELIAKVVGGISSPLYGIVNVLSGPLRSFAYVLQARRDQLEQAA